MNDLIKITLVVIIAASVAGMSTTITTNPPPQAAAQESLQFTSVSCQQHTSPTSTSVTCTGSLNDPGSGAILLQASFITVTEGCKNPKNGRILENSIVQNTVSQDVQSTYNSGTFTVSTSPITPSITCKGIMQPVIIPESTFYSGSIYAQSADGRFADTTFNRV